MIFIEDQKENDSTYRPPDLNTKHYYNLQNQSWGVPRKNEAGTLEDPISGFAAVISRYPSDSEVVWTGLQYKPVSTTEAPTERVFYNLYNDSLGVTSQSAKGYFIIDLLRRGESRQEAYTVNKEKYSMLASPAVVFPQDYTQGGATIVKSFAGRVFYAGFSGEVIDGDIRSPNLSNYILFSQLIRNQKDFVKCYQEGDPSSREDSDIVDTDGGFIKLAGAERIIGMEDLGSHLVVIASNGVWVISGGSDYGFTAANYKADKITSYGGLAIDSIVEVNGKVFYWSDSGIYVVAKDQFGSLVVQSITDDTIQKLYKSIPTLSKAASLATYDAENKTIRWLYKTGVPFTNTSETYELILNLSINAFYKNKIYSPTDYDIEVFASFSSSNLAYLQQNDDVFVDVEAVLSDVETVIVPERISVENTQSTRYLFLQPSPFGGYSVGIALYRNTDFKDWNEVDAYAYMLSGEQTGGDSSLAKQIPYLTMHFYRTELGVNVDGIPLYPSSCLVHCQWDWATSITSRRFSTAFEAYRYNQARFTQSDNDTFDTGMKIITTKSKIRGRGKAFSFFMETSPGKDCQIVGWNLALNANSIT